MPQQNATFYQQEKKNLNDIVNAFTKKVTDDLELAFAFYKVLFFFLFLLTEPL